MKSVLIIVLFLFCCSTSQENEKDAFLVGYWIPEKIKWEKPKNVPREIAKVVRYANFKTLCFDKNNAFVMLQSIQSFPIGYDSLVFEYEPGIELYSGRWELAQSDMAQLAYSLGYSPFGVSASKIYKDSIRIVHDKGKTKLLMGETAFIKTQLFDRKSLEKIEAYKQEYGN